MTTATPTRTLADVFRERIAGDGITPTSKLDEAINGVADAMTPYHSEDLPRPVQIWLDAQMLAVQDAAWDAAVAALIEGLVGIVYDAERGKAPVGFVDYATDALRSDIEVAREVARADLAALEAER